MEERSDSISQLAAALAHAQGGFPALSKNCKVDVSKGGKFLYTFFYADLTEIVRVTTPVLMKHGLAIVHVNGVSVDGLHLDTYLVHESGEWMRSRFIIMPGEGSDIKDVGGLITYSKRYNLTGLLNISAEDDNDANAGASGRGDTHAQLTTKAAPEKPPPGRLSRIDEIINDNAPYLSLPTGGDEVWPLDATPPLPLMPAKRAGAGPVDFSTFPYTYKLPFRGSQVMEMTREQMKKEGGRWNAAGKTWHSMLYYEALADYIVMQAEPKEIATHG